MIKIFEKFIKSIKIGDYVECNLDSYEPTILIYDQMSDNIFVFEGFIKNGSMYGERFNDVLLNGQFIGREHIIRKSTQDEIEIFEARKNAKKYNL